MWKKIKVKIESFYVWQLCMIYSYGMISVMTCSIEEIAKYSDFQVSLSVGTAKILFDPLFVLFYKVSQKVQQESWILYNPGRPEMKYVGICQREL